jgi:hypothetical protein
MLFVCFELLHPALFDELDHPSRIEVHAKANSAAMLAQVFHGKPQPSRARRAQHQPVGAFRKLFIRQRLAEHFIVNAEILDGEPALWNSSGAPGFKNEERFASETFWQPALQRTAQPLVFKRREPF